MEDEQRESEKEDDVGGGAVFEVLGARLGSAALLNPAPSTRQEVSELIGPPS